MTIRVRFYLEAEDRTVEATAEEGELLMQVAYRAGIILQTTCGGKASCLDCKVRVTEGLESGFEKAGLDEVRALGNVFHITRERLACQALVKGDSAVHVAKRERKKRGK